MAKTSETLIFLWRRRDTGVLNRLAMPRRLALVVGGGVLLTALSALLFGATTLHLHRAAAGVYAKLAQVEADRSALSRRLAALEGEVLLARDGLGRVRSEEARIRQWLGVGEREPAPLRPDPSGGQGSLGDVDLEAIAPADRMEADADIPEGESGALEAAGGWQGIGAAAQSLAADLADLADRLRETKRHWDAVPSISPVDGQHSVSSPFGWRKSPFGGRREFHSGLDLAGARGTAVVASAGGTVSRVVRDPDLGRTVTVDHGNGIETVYGHLDRVLVSAGQRVARGDEVGKLGSTGARSTGPHLHYSVRVDGKYVNPANYLLDPPGRQRFAAAKR